MSARSLCLWCVSVCVRARVRACECVSWTAPGARGLWSDTSESTRARVLHTQRRLGASICLGLAAGAGRETWLDRRRRVWTPEASLASRGGEIDGAGRKTQTNAPVPGRPRWCSRGARRRACGAEYGPVASLSGRLGPECAGPGPLRESPGQPLPAGAARALCTEPRPGRPIRVAALSESCSSPLRRGLRRPTRSARTPKAAAGAPRQGCDPPGARGSVAWAHFRFVTADLTRNETTKPDVTKR